MLLTAVNIIVAKTTADIFSGEGDFNGVNDLVDDNVDFILRNTVSLGNMGLCQLLGNVLHFLLSVENQVKGNKQRPCIFAAQDLGIIN